MDTSAIGVALGIVQSVTGLICAMRQKSELLERTEQQLELLNGHLKTLSSDHQKYTLTKEQFQLWVKNQRTCNQNLRKIGDIIWRINKDARSRYSLLHDVAFQIGLKAHLERRVNDFERSVRSFVKFAEITMHNRSSLGGLKNTGSGKIGPMSIGQFVQMFDEEDADEELPNAHAQM